MNISKGRSKGRGYEAGNSFRNIEFIIITNEHAETLIMASYPHNPVLLAPCLCYPQSIFPWAFLFEIHLILPVQILFKLQVPPSVDLLLHFHSFL